MKPKSLLDSDSESDSEESSRSNYDNDSDHHHKRPKEDPEKSVRFNINTKYARDYQSRKQREELQRSRAEDNDDDSDGGDSDDSSSSSTEDEDADLLTPQLDVDILKTINALRAKDKTIYDPNVRFFPGSDAEDDDSDEDEDKKQKKSKPKRVKDVLREQILQQMDEEDNDNPKDEANNNANEKTSRLAYDEQQQELRKAFLDEDGDNSSQDGDDDKEEDDFLVIKKRHTSTSEEDEQAKNLFDDEMKRMEATSGNRKGELVDPRGEVEDGEKFLLNFIKNKTWMEDDGANFDELDDDDAPPKDKLAKHHIAYDEGRDGDDDSLEDVEKADDFEAQYNFRFEEANTATASGADFSVRGYARSQTMNTLRRKDETRRNKRLARKERKEAERKAKEEKLKRLKNAKREEIERKMKQVKAVLGAGAGETVEASEDAEKKAFIDGEAPIDEAAIMKLLEGDYDPKKFEESMQKAFGDDFYEKEDSEWKTDDDVRETLKRDGDVELYDYDEAEDEVAPANANADNGQDEDYEHEGQDEDYDENAYGDDDMKDEHHEDETELEKKVRSKMMDKLYELDYEDIVAGMPTRFKYREVEPNNYGLTTEEILLARDHTLKQYVSLKKMAPYRENEEYHVSSRKRRKFRELLKEDIAEAEAKLKEEGVTVNTSASNAEDENQTKKKKRRRLKKKGGKSARSKADDDDDDDDDGGPNKPEAVEKNVPTEATNEIGNNKPKKRRKKNKKIKTTNQSDSQLPDTRQKEPTAKTMKSEEAMTAVSEPGQLGGNVPVGGNERKKKKKKRKKKDVTVQGLSQSRLESYGL